MRYHYRTVITLLALVLLVSLTGCGSEPPKPSAENVKATAALGKLEEMRKAYNALDAAGVLAHVSSGFQSGYADFSSGLRRDCNSFKMIELNLAIDRVELTPGFVVVTLHWHGKWWDKSGKMVEGRGNTELSFLDDEKMALVKLVGDNPFGISR